MTLTRRDALKLGGISVLGAAALGTPLGAGAQTRSVSLLSKSDFPKRYDADFRRLRVLAPRPGTNDYVLTARYNPEVRLLPGGLRTPIWGYDGEFPGPVIEVEKGTPATLTIRNHMPRQASGLSPFGSQSQLSTHLHGSASLPEYDGFANDLTEVGQLKTYHYPNSQSARTLWYHDHAAHWTAQQVYGGLVGMYVMKDKPGGPERTKLPTGEFDVPLMVSDAMFAADGSLAYDDNTHSGVWGDVILVNGRPWPKMTVKRRTYRFRILNCSIARSYTWKLSNGMPLQVVATDGGLMPKGVAVTSMRQAGAERYEVVIDFSKVPADTRRIELLNLSNENNRDYDFTGKVMAFDLDDPPLTPEQLAADPTSNRNYHGYALADSDIMSLPAKPAAGSYIRRSFRVSRDDVTNVWKFGDQSWQEVVDSAYQKVLANPQAGATEIWEIENKGGGWFHPVHVHLVDFRVLARTGGVGRVLPHEAGPKDVVYVGESEKVTLLITFTINPESRTLRADGTPDPDSGGGHYMVHCHNLPHEDHDMMGQFRVGRALFATDPHNPITAALPVTDPAYRDPDAGT